MTETSAKPAAEMARELRVLLGDAFTAMDCRRALACCDHDLARAADWLADGHWLGAKLVSWDHASLQAKAAAMAADTGATADHCLRLLRNCAGNVELAKRKHQGLPALA